MASHKYYLPCECGKSIVIELGQAGQTVRCDCGANLEVPTMRHIRQLQSVTSQSPAAPRRTRSWNVAQGLLFSTGLFVLVGATAVAGYYQWGRMQLDVEEQKGWDNIDEAFAIIDSLNVEQTWDSWVNIRKEGIGPYRPPRFIVNRTVSHYWRGIVLRALLVSAVGLVLIIGAFLVPNKQAAKSRRPG